MPGPVLYDAVTLRHFGCTNRLDVLRTRHSFRDPPRWTETVKAEISAGRGQMDCDAVLAESWLGTPWQAGLADLKGIFRLQAGLNLGVRPALDHAGEAESLYLADISGGDFITDDNAAYDFGRRMLGDGRVRDTVDVLRDAVAMGELTESEAQLVANGIRNSGRHLRRVHPTTLVPSYFS